jgi:hypothetical protein
MLTALLFAVATTATVPPDVDVCMRAAAAATHSTLADTDQSGCVCTVAQLRKYLSAGDYALHQTMESIIASGADEKSFNTHLSAIMLKRGMDQTSADAFLARSRAAEARANGVCNPSPLLNGQ